MHRDSALYFPYIDVPPGQWLNRVLLYWDWLGSIVPFDYTQRPEQHSPFMRDLLTSGLVRPVMPMEHIRDTHRFADVFLHDIEKRRRLPSQFPTRPARIHIEKLGRLGTELVERGLARRISYAWYEVDAGIARRFMAYLATVLGSQPSVRAAPITYDQASFRSLGGSSLRDVDNARTLLLRQVFPRPRGHISLDELVEFKETHGTQLRRLRRAIEMKSIEIASTPESKLRRERATLIAADLEDQIGEVEEAMRGRWNDVVIGGIGIVSAVAPLADAQPGVGAGIAATGGVILAAQAMLAGGRRADALKNPLAYAALARSRFRLQEFD